MLHAGYQQIERLIRRCLLGRKIDVVTFVEELLAISTQVGEMTCRRVDNRGLRFEVSGIQACEVEVDANVGKLRMCCARIAVLCGENGHELMIYGGQGTIQRTAKVELVQNESEQLLYHLLWKARWMNTPGEHWFTLSVLR
jgi:hypothetical protein